MHAPPSFSFSEGNTSRNWYNVFAVYIVLLLYSRYETMSEIILQKLLDSGESYLNTTFWDIHSLFILIRNGGCRKDRRSGRDQPVSPEPAVSFPDRWNHAQLSAPGTHWSRTTDAVCRFTQYSQIASFLRFCDQSYFTAVFRRETGILPGRYRAEYHIWQYQP